MTNREREAEADCAAMRAAIEYLFAPGPGVAVPGKYDPDYGEPHHITWNKKIDALQAVLDAPHPGASLLAELEAAREVVDLARGEYRSNQLRDAIAKYDAARGAR